MEQEEVARLTVEEVKAHLDRGDAVILVDVRKESVYARAHIRGAICLPVTDFESRLDQLPTARHLVFY
jgi:rhodanese-related sulfurtransferase